jgi:ribosomal protein S18 acetylase RimI-like enzyme
VNDSASTPTTTCKVELLGPTEAAALADEIRAIYRTAFAVSSNRWDKSELGISAFENDIFPRHLAREGFGMTTARNHEGKLVGFCYGYIGEHGQYWTDYVAARIHPSLEKAWLGGHFEIAELAVEADERGKGLGRALLTTLLDSRGEDRVALQTLEKDSAALPLYESLGFTAFGEFENYVVLGQRRGTSAA